MHFLNCHNTCLPSLCSISFPAPCAISIQTPCPDAEKDAEDTLDELEDAPIEVPSDSNSSVELVEDDKTELGVSHLVLKLCKPNWFVEWLSKDWDAPIYVFFKPTAMVEYVDGHKSHVFECATQSCQGRSRFVLWYLDKGDAKLTSNLSWHAKSCWGDDTVSLADNSCNTKPAHEVLSHNKKMDGSITSAFQHMAKGQPTYSHCQHTKIQAQYTLLSGLETSHPKKVQYQICTLDRWEQTPVPNHEWSWLPLSTLMKTGQPGYHIPSLYTLSCDVWKAFVQAHTQISKLLQVRHDPTTNDSHIDVIARTMMANWILQWMPGLSWITRHMLHLPFT